ncbi:protein of unknown function [Legionella micdadei]|uniref:Uncharacterized protein n=1 Tax=Legionella micdadei TaxID=451 RepID=A0A098GIP4_LEGMI|nr:protein of unknown function [Legionella micdadei]
MRRNICRYHACGLSYESWVMLKVDIFCYEGLLLANNLIIVRDKIRFIASSN